MCRLDRCERIELLKLAVESGAGPDSVVACAQEMESYVLGHALDPRETAEDWVANTGDTAN